MQTFLFGEFELDLGAYELRRRGEPVKVERRPFDLLVLLVEQSGRMVPREEIVAALWPSTVIIDFDSGLRTLVRKLRTVLGDSPADPQFIETVPGRGYRFIKPVALAPDPSLSAVPATVRPGPAQGGTNVPWSRVAIALGSVVTLAAGVFAWRAFDTQEWPKAITVLPFENLTGNDDLNYIVYGLAEDTSIALNQIDPARLLLIDSSSRAPVDPTLSISERGRQLGVDYAVQCSLRSEATKIRLTCPLVRITDGEQFWLEPLERELTNVIGLSRELSIAIAQQVRLRLSPEVAAAIDRRQTQNAAAYALYLNGRTEWMKFTPASMRRALESFEQAADEDPDYALAWAGIAFAAITSMRTADAPPVEMKNKARSALAHAEQLGSDLVETQYARGYFSLFGDLDRTAAAASARAALDLDPYNAQAYMLLGAALMRDDPVDSLEMMHQARIFGPMFAIAWANSANAALATGDPVQALEFARQTIAIDPDFWVGHYYLGAALSALGNREEALAAYAKAATLSNGISLTYTARIGLLVDLGRTEDAQRLAQDLAALAEDRYVPAYARAIVYAVLGDKESALSWLRQSVENRDVGLPGMATERDLQSLHDDPRFWDLVASCDCGPPAAARPVR